MKIIIFGSVPPPIGGVTKSIQNLLFALKSQSVSAKLFTKVSLSKKYDIAHVHYSKSWKRFIGILASKIMAKKVIFTLHGNFYENGIFNYLNSKMADGVILLNKTTENKYKYKFKNTIVLSSIFAEGVDQINNKAEYIKKVSNKTYLLVYAYNKIYQNSKDIYGIDFILDNLDSFNETYKIVLLDPKAAYQDDITESNENKLIYINFEVDFLSLLKEVDIYLRPTVTDGSSVAVQEALMIGKTVLASDVVERPNEVTTYKNGNVTDFFYQLTNIKENIKGYQPDSIEDYLKFCERILEK